MLYLVAKNKKNRRKYAAEEKKKNLIKAIINNWYLCNTQCIFARKVLFQIAGYRSYLKNYCIISGRSRGIIRPYNISRIYFKQLTSFGYLKGIKKMSW